MGKPKPLSPTKYGDERGASAQSGVRHKRSGLGGDFLGQKGCN